MTINPICHIFGWGISFTTTAPMMSRDTWYRWADGVRSIRIGSWELLAWRSSYRRRT